MRSFEEDLSRAIAFHGHLCGGQITGVRMARYALKYFGIEDPDHYRDRLCRMRSLSHGCDHGGYRLPSW